MKVVNGNSLNELPKLEPGEWTLTEVEAPLGYGKKAVPVSIIVAADGTIKYKQSDFLAGEELTAQGTVPTVCITNRFSPSLDIMKVDKANENTSLSGAVFELHQLEEDGYGTYLSGVDPVRTDPTGDDGKTTLSDLLEGCYYKIEEVVFPSGYILTGNSAFYFKVSAGKIIWLEEDTNKTVVNWGDKDSDEMVSFTPATETQNARFTVKNEAGAALPYTGGIGTVIFYVLGAVLVLGAGVVLVSKRRVTDR